MWLDVGLTYFARMAGSRRNALLSLPSICQKAGLGAARFARYMAGLGVSLLGSKGQLPVGVNNLYEICVILDGNCLVKYLMLHKINLPSVKLLSNEYLQNSSNIISQQI
jgi:hypothetical protein